jgi:hypothetical protein
LDVLRGIALAVIFVTHIPGNIYAGMTPAALGYADAAEAFVLIAGFAAYHAYMRRFLSDDPVTAALPIITRVWQLYVTHLALVFLVFGVSAWAARVFGDPHYLEAMALDTFLADPAQAAIGVMTLGFLPNYLDILPLYIVLLALLPLVLASIRLHWALPLGLSALGYLAAQLTGWNLPNMQASAVWFFNPLAWQFLFVVGVVMAHLSATQRLEALFARKRLVLAITWAAALYAFVSLLSVAPWRQIPPLANTLLIDPAWLPVADKTNLSPLRLVDAFAKAWLLAVLIPRAASWLSSPPARAFGMMGRQSLPVFVLGLILSVVASVIVREAGFDKLVQTAVVVGGIGLMAAFAALLEWQAQSQRAARAPRDLGAQPQPARETTARETTARESTPASNLANSSQ